MGTGIVVCGLNGAGKNTLGKALAQKLHFYFMDAEYLYFSKTDAVYAHSRTHAEAAALLLRKIRAHEKFVLASVNGDYGEAIYPFFQYVVLVDAPKQLRMQRVKNRSFQKFGNRMLPGGDLYKQEERFFDLVHSRTKTLVEEWAQTLNCPIIRVDGTKPVEENTTFIIQQIQK